MALLTVKVSIIYVMLDINNMKLTYKLVNILCKHG